MILTAMDSKQLTVKPRRKKRDPVHTQSSPARNFPPKESPYYKMVASSPGLTVDVAAERTGHTRVNARKQLGALAKQGLLTWEEVGTGKGQKPKAYYVKTEEQGE